MSQNRPDDDTLYQALLNRDLAYKDRVYVAVTSTKIYCQLTCPARKPKPENCVFMTDKTQCETKGFRPCKRCFPERYEATS